MSPLRPEDLPPAVRAKLLASLNAPTRRRTTKAEDHGPGLPVGCASCPARWDRWSETATVRHMREQGHHRFEALF